MNILYIGAGFVGACSATISADSGHDTLVLMLMPKIAALGSGDRDTIEGCLFEDGLGDCWFAILIGFVLPLITAMREFLNNCDAVFMCLPTPEIGETGESDLRYYVTAAKSWQKPWSKK